MTIYCHENTKTFHLQNDRISYIMTALKNGQLGQVYFGASIRDREDFSHLVEATARPMSSNLFFQNKAYSLEHLKQEYPCFGSGDYRGCAFSVTHEDGSTLSDLKLKSWRVVQGKPALAGLPATYVEEEAEAETLVLCMEDDVSGLCAEYFYTIYRDYPVICRSVRFENRGMQHLVLDRAMSFCLDLSDDDYEMLQLSGAWSRERHIMTRKLCQGIQSIGSIRGHSSHHHNPFLVIKRPDTNETAGQLYAFSLIYSGNFLMQAEVDAHRVTRIMGGIHPDTFRWNLPAGENFQTPEAVLCFTDRGMDDMSQTYHKLYRTRLARGHWRDRVRPILINNWEATYFDFDEEKLLTIAKTARDCGVELFVLDDGWFGQRNGEKAGLGDWFENRDRLPNGIPGIAKRVAELGMGFGLWFEPEMVNEDSDLFREHPEYRLDIPNRPATHGRFQYVLDFSRKEVVDLIYDRMYAILSSAPVSYIKCDMNRSITECFSRAWPARQQGEIYHRYILGVYDLFERLNRAFPELLIESCSSGGGRFDPGMLHYAPQGWTSDDTDAHERVLIQYGTSLCYPVSSMGSHVSVVPNHQTNRMTPLFTRANVAYFGTFGYELDLNDLTDEEREEVKAQIAFMKKYRDVIQFGSFHRLRSPFEGNIGIWQVVSEDKCTSIVGVYKSLTHPITNFDRIALQGLCPDTEYTVDGKGSYFGDELMHAGLVISDASAGEPLGHEKKSCDFDSHVYVIEKRKVTI